MPANPLIILKGNLELSADGTAWTDVSCWATEFLLSGTREEKEAAGTLCTGEPTKFLGGAEWAITIGYLGEIGAGITLWDMLYEAFVSTTGELMFRGSLTDAVVSATNPEWSGTALVNNLDIGGAVGEMWQSTPQYPIKSGTFLRSDTAGLPLEADTADADAA